MAKPRPKNEVPLNYYQEKIDSLKRKEKKANTVLVYTHVEIDPQLIWVCASLVPYPEHNSTPGSLVGLQW